MFRVFRRLKYTQTHSQSNIAELKYWICHIHCIISHSSLPLPSLLHSLSDMPRIFIFLFDLLFLFLSTTPPFSPLFSPYSPPSPSLELVLVGLILTLDESISPKIHTTPPLHFPPSSLYLSSILIPHPFLFHPQEHWEQPPHQKSLQSSTHLSHPLAPRHSKSGYVNRG